MIRNKSFLLVALLIVLVAAASLALRKKPDDYAAVTRKIAALYRQELHRLDACLEQYPRYFYDSSYAARLAKYTELARQLGRVEALFAYVQPQLVYNTLLKTPQFESRDFGPPLPDNWLLLGPFGIDPDSTLAKMKEADKSFSRQFINRSVTNFRKLLKDSRTESGVDALNAEDQLDALRLQMARISTMGLANAHMVITEAGLPSLEGAFSFWADAARIWTEALPAGETELKKTIHRKLDEGNRLLSRQADFNAFDRMQFLTDFLIPLSRSLNRMQAVLNVAPKPALTAFHSAAAGIYEADAFNADFFAPGEEAYLSAAKAELGKLLFFDPLLSGNNERACASCHKPELAFTDGNTRSMNFERGELPRNAPTVINAAFQKAQFWDLRTGSLEDQLDSVINSPDEMHSSFDDVLSIIRNSDEYQALFHAAFPDTRKEGIGRKHVKIAIASYERTLTGLNSRFDQYVRGDKTKLTPSEISGFNIYMGKAKCGTCHYAPLFSGSLPPYFEFTDHRPIGVPLQKEMTVYAVDADTGASKVFKTPFTQFSFKTPTVRNVELTAPYMHNGVFRSLEEVVDFYEDAGGVKFFDDMKPGLKGLPFFMILPQKLNLTGAEKKDLVAFLMALTDTSSARNIPARLPQIKGRFAHLNNRKVGGVY